MLGVAAAQGNPAPAQSTPASDQQTSTPAQPSAQQTATYSATEAHPTRIAPGSVIPVSLTKTIDAKKAKTGDEVVAKVTQDLKSNAGTVIVAKDTEVVGHVTEAQPRNKEQKESQVGITFDHAVMKDGSEMHADVYPGDRWFAEFGFTEFGEQCRRKQRSVSERRSRWLSQFVASRRDGRIHAVACASDRVARQHANRYTDEREHASPDYGADRRSGRNLRSETDAAADSEPRFSPQFRKE